MNISGIPHLEFRKGKDEQKHKQKSEFDRVLEKEEKKLEEKQKKWKKCLQSHCIGGNIISTKDITRESEVAK